MVLKINWTELFPTKCSILVFILYILLFVNQGILVTASQESNNSYHYDIITVVLLTEVFKLCASIILYCKDHTFMTLINESIKSKTILGLYCVPALLYCFYNNLSFVNLATFDPTTYYLLLQLRVVITAILFQIIFKKKLSSKQWLSLLILTGGCMLKQMDFYQKDTKATTKSTGFKWDINAVLILIQASCSCLAGVYNEYILKKPGADVHIYIQNVFMYLDSIVCNGFLLLIQGKVSVFTLESLSRVFHFKVLLIMLNNTAIGIITSFFLKNLNSIVKTFASALELIFTAVLSYLFFGIPIYINTVLAILTVMYALFLYSQNPVSNVSNEKSHNQDKEPLLEEV